MLQKGIITNVQRFTIHDGPGMRTELFLKGCPLKCEWCSNPESLKPYIEPGVYESKCISYEKCGLCVEACPEEGVLSFNEGKLTSIDRRKCTGCLACYDACPSDAIKQWGKIKTVEECMVEIRKDKGYYDRSGGGVTVSGGEPLVQSDFVAALFKACKEEGIHTCLESSFHGDWKEIQKILPYTDLIISDIKHMDRQIHEKHTGVGNEIILKNLQRIAGTDREIILRIPVIPEVNDDKANIKATADFILNDLDGKVRTLQLLSFMRLGEEKYQSLGMPYGMDHVKLDRESFQKKVGEIAAYFNHRGIHCQVGTKEKQ
ncbi:(2S)-3-sulfopropanediol dehydratase activating enzyme [Isachenkonia alkalipeptolytica]|uniref:Glycyl-radical enzyme activating protein n=1 Tax=Isachenkonia alkalipeptolytica TaxID=2565777 RepID=A0AA44BED9_9CLOT|nr:glycyl-radical enzyme activating protein [Isachenkonia alkalipeptolytica]NBG88858.1 glycyl-radical enzyme activating protein [Isachenkonia alkalipeptolytica]